MDPISYPVLVLMRHMSFRSIILEIPEHSLKKNVLDMPDQQSRAPA